MSPSNISIINNYIKNTNNLDVNDVQDAQLPQSESYLNILGIPYLIKNTNTPINLNVLKGIIKATHVFNDIKITSKPYVCRVSPKSNMAIMLIDIWDSQNSLSAKKVINQSFNIESFITTVRDANMNSGATQCKNCWKWGYMMFVCHFQGSQCVKCNGPHKTEHHHHFGWCCKANFKINLPHLETKQSKPCPHTFKCINYKGDHQANSNTCPFWCHCFNKEWYSKKIPGAS